MTTPEPNLAMCVLEGCDPGAAHNDSGLCEACAPGNYCAGGDTAAVGCEQGQWDHDANPATTCATQTACVAGQYVSADGSATSDRACAACPASAFSASDNAASCTPWQICAAGTAQSTPPSATVDRTCDACTVGTYCAGDTAAPVACAAGTWDHDANAATACESHSVCAAGQVLAVAGTSTENAQCSACAAGTYCAGGEAPAVACGAANWDDDASAATPCVDWSTCAPGTSVSSTPSATDDRLCTVCVAGSFSTTSNASQCDPWQTCEAFQAEVQGTATTNSTCLNEAPALIDTAGAVARYFTSEIPSAVAPALTISDADDATLSFVTVRISGNPVAAEDVLALSVSTSLDASWSASTSTFTLSGTAPLATYETALRSLTYQNLSASPSLATRTVSFRAHDGHGLGPVATSTVQLPGLCPLDDEPTPVVVVNRDFGIDGAQWVPFRPLDSCIDANNEGCRLPFALQGNDGVQVFDALDMVNPRQCTSADPGLSYHWEIFFPTANGGAKYTSAGMAGYFAPSLVIQPGSLPNLAGGLWRVVLTVTEPERGGAPPLVTVYKFRFEYQNSILTQSMSTNCQSPLVELNSQCTVAAGLPVPPGTPT